MTTIKIENLEIFANHGVLKEENTLGQKFVISVEIDVPARLKDAIGETVNYAEVCEFTEQYMRGNTFALIETAAAALAREIMCRFPQAERTRVEVKKPWAPIKLNVEYVSAAVERKRSRAYIAVGSNMGDRRQHLNMAIAKIDENPFCRVLKRSDFIETKPWGNVKQNDFLNGCIEIETLLEPFELLEFLHECEDADGRTREVHWGPRTIDLDIIYYDDIVLVTDELTIPHKECEKRPFVLEPLAQLAPYKRDPLSGFTVREMADKLKENEE